MDPITLISILNMILTSIKNPEFVVTESQKKEINLIIDDLSDLKKLDTDNKTKKELKTKKIKSEKTETIFPEVSLEKHILRNNGKDSVDLRILTKDKNGKNVSNAKIEVSITFDGVRKVKNFVSDKNGLIKYSVPIKKNACLLGDKIIEVFTEDGFYWEGNIEINDVSDCSRNKSNNTNASSRIFNTSY